MRALPIGVPKVMVSTMASGDTRPYVGPSDICMMYSVTDVQGINRISEKVLANAAHVKNVPGRKTDVNDSMWLADLLAHGLIRASFVPPVAVTGSTGVRRAMDSTTATTDSAVWPT